MLKPIKYKADSVIYFSGDVADRIFLLISGSLSFTYIDIETGAQVTEYVKPGEFFGVKSALGGYPREESVMVLTDSTLYVFTVEGFEQFASENSRIIFQMIKVFSKQLRKVHWQLKSLSSDDSVNMVNNEDGLYSVVTAFLNSEHYSAAVNVAKRYLSFYPTGDYVSQMKDVISEYASQAGIEFGKKEHEKEGGVIQPSNTVCTQSECETILRLAQDAEKQGDWTTAYSKYHGVMELGILEFKDVASIGAGKSLYNLKNYAKCVQLLTTFVAKNPKSVYIPYALFYLGLCYEDTNKLDKAQAFYKKAFSIAPDDLANKIKEKLSVLGVK